MASIDSGLPFVETASGTTVATATHDAVAGTTYYITQVPVSSDQTASAAIKNGGTTIYQFRISSPGIMTHTVNFSPALKATTGNLVSVTMLGAASCFANITGYEL